MASGECETDLLEELKNEDGKVNDLINRIEVLKNSFKLLKEYDLKEKEEDVDKKYYLKYKVIPELESDCMAKVTEMIGRISPLPAVEELDVVEDIIDIKGKLSGILDMERQMRGTMDGGGGLMHVRGPVDGNPYAQIDHSLKGKCRPQPPPIDYNLSRGIEDLEDLLCDLGNVGTTINSITSQNQNYKDVIPDMSMKTMSHGVQDWKVRSVMNGQVAEKREVKKYRPNLELKNVGYSLSSNHDHCPTENIENNHTKKFGYSPTRYADYNPSTIDNVFKEPVSSPTVNDLFFVIDKPCSPRTKNLPKKTLNLSAYDNMDDSVHDSHTYTPHARGVSPESKIEIQSGTVAKHVKNLQKFVNTNENRPNNPVRNGVPMAGLVSPVAFHNKQQQHSPTYPTRYGNGVLPSGYQQNHIVRKEVDMDSNHRYEHKSNTRNEGYGEIRREEDFDPYTKRIAHLSGSDSVDGGSLRSSTSSPLLTPATPRIDNSYVLDDENGIMSGRITGSGESYSPKSDGINEISSGIASRTSSMTSLGSSNYDNKHADVKSSDTSKSNSNSTEENRNLINHAGGRADESQMSLSSTSSTTRCRPTLTFESEIHTKTISESQHHSESTNIDMKIPITISTDNSCSTPRGILKTMDINDDRQLDVGDQFLARSLSMPSSESRSAARFAERSTSLGSSPDDCGVHLVDQPPYTARKLSVGSSTGSEGPHSPRSTGSTTGSGGRQSMRRLRSRGGSTGSNSSLSSSELFHEITRNTSVRFDKETMYLWYRPKITREDATAFLRDKPPGAFVVRDSQSFEGGFGLAVKVETPPTSVLQQAGGDMTKIDLDSELVRHFLIEPCKQGVRLKGSENESPFPSLMALIYQHSLTKMSLPVELVIPLPPELENDARVTLTEAQILEKGACCNLVYLGAVDVESLTGDGAIHYAMNKVTSQNIQSKATTINIKVNHKGITLTDNQRRIFFRRHYVMKNVIHCGIDPKGRKISLKPLIENCDREVECFGFVVRNEAKSMITIPTNECHICAEIDPNQPASAVINFIHKAMRYSRV